MGPNKYAVVVDGLPEPASDEPTVIFHGVNKSGSLTMSNVLFHGYRDSGRIDQFLSAYRGVTNAEIMARIAGPPGHTFCVAHYLYGRYRHEPSEHLLTTQFRNPLPRARSCYQWLRNKADQAGEAFPGFEEWVLATGGTRHTQVEQFALGYGPGARETPTSRDGAAMLELAKANIERDVHWFGIAEYFEESVFSLAAICGLAFVRRWQEDRRNPNRPLVDVWTDAEIEVVRETFRWDFALYEWAVDTFRRRLLDLEFGPELNRYKNDCRAFYKDRLDVDGTPLSPRREKVARVRVDRPVDQ